MDTPSVSKRRYILSLNNAGIQAENWWARPAHKDRADAGPVGGCALQAGDISAASL